MPFFRRSCNLCGATADMWVAPTDVARLGKTHIYRSKNEEHYAEHVTLAETSGPKSEPLVNSPLNKRIAEILNEGSADE